MKKQTKNAKQTKQVELKKYVATVVRNGATFPISIKAESVKDVKVKLEGYTYEKIISIQSKEEVMKAKSIESASNVLYRSKKFI